MNSLENLTKDKSKHGLHKFKFYFEDIKEDNYKVRRVTFPDRAWNLIDHIGLNLISTARYLLRTFRRLT